MAGYVYPPTSFYFKVQIDGFPDDLGFQSVDGLNADIPTTGFDHQEGGENTYTHHFPGPITYKDLTLKRGMRLGSSLIGWFNDAIQNFEFDPRDVTVTLMGPDGGALEQWIFRNAWPKSWNIESFDAESSSKPAIESIVLSYQYFYRVGIAPPQ